MLHCVGIKPLIYIISHGQKYYVISKTHFIKTHSLTLNLSRSKFDLCLIRGKHNK